MTLCEPIIAKESHCFDHISKQYSMRTMFLQALYQELRKLRKTFLSMYGILLTIDVHLLFLHVNMPVDTIGAIHFWYVHSHLVIALRS